jgi:hypothetical protein
MERKKLIFFVRSDPQANLDAVRSAYLMATTALEAGIPAEVRLAGDAVTVPGRVPAGPRGDQVRAMIERGREQGLLVSL